MRHKCWTLAVVCVIACGLARGADETDPVKEKLLAAKGAYDAEMKQFRKLAGAWFDTREDGARQAGDKKVVDQIKAERKAFDDLGELPRGVPSNISQKSALARKLLEVAYSRAVKEYVQVKKDDEAAAVEKVLLDFRKELWRHVDLSNVKVHDGYVRIPPNTYLPTVQKHAGAVEVVVVARTESENIRLHAQKGAVVIFNWEENPRELRVTRPDGSDQLESGSLATAKITPLKPNTWYTIKWRLTEGGTQVSLDGKTVFEEQRRNDLTATAPITVQAVKSAVDLKEFRVTPIGKGR